MFLILLFINVTAAETVKFSLSFSFITVVDEVLKVYTKYGNIISHIVYIENGNYSFSGIVLLILFINIIIAILFLIFIDKIIRYFLAQTKETLEYRYIEEEDKLPIRKRLRKYTLILLIIFLILSPFTISVNRIIIV